MKKTKRKLPKAPKVEKVSVVPSPEINKVDPNDQDDYGGIPMRDLKKNLGCG